MIFLFFRYNMKLKIPKTLKCSPGRKNKEHSCFTDKEIKQIHKILLKHKKFSGKIPLNLVTQIKDLNVILKDSFRPVSTWSKDGWLSIYDINNVMKQYDDIYPNFVFLGTKLSDFYETNDLIHEKLDKNKKYGFIFRLKGEKNNCNEAAHWVSLLLYKNRIEYFDSVPHILPNSMIYIIERISLHWLLLTNQSDIKLKVNTKRVQHFNGDCGIFAIDYLIKRMSGISMEKYIKTNFTESYIKDLRDFYYNKN